MNKYKRYFLPLLLFSLVPAFSNAVNSAEPVATPLTGMSILEQNKAYENRILVIKEMDKSQLNSNQKKELRKELRTMKKAINNGGVYLSVGSIIIIVLLLILLL